MNKLLVAGVALSELLWLGSTANLSAAAPDQRVALKGDLLRLAERIGPPPGKAPEAPPQALQAILAAGDWQFSVQFAARIGSEPSQVNALVAILGKASELHDQDLARAVLAEVAAVAAGVSDPALRARLLADCAAAAANLGATLQAHALLNAAHDLTAEISQRSSLARG